MNSNRSLTLENLALAENAKEHSQYILTSKGKLRRETPTGSSTKTSLVLKISVNSLSQAKGNFFRLGKWQVETSPCKQYLVLYFLEAELVWLLDLKQQIWYRFDWSTADLKKVDRCSITFKENSAGELQPLEAIEVRPEKEADLITTQAILCSICGNPKEGLMMATSKLPPDSAKLAIACEKVGRLARDTGDYRTAQHALNEALRTFQKTLGATSEPVARVHMELGNLYDEQGSYEGALDSFSAARDIRLRLFGDRHATVAETFYCMAFTLEHQGSLDEALDCVDCALRIQKETCGPTSKEVANSTNLMGFVQTRRGKLDTAIELFQEACEIRGKHGDLNKLSQSLMNLGNAHREKEEYEQALECYEECLKIRKAEFGYDHEKVACALVGIANVQCDQDKYEAAKHKYEEALSIRRAWFGENDNRIADVMQRIGKMDFEHGEYGNAYEGLTKVIEIREANGARDGDYVNALFMIGNIHKLRDNEEDAKLFWSKAYDTFLELGMAEESPRVGAKLEKLLGIKEGHCKKLRRGKDRVKKPPSQVAVKHEYAESPARRQNINSRPAPPPRSRSLQKWGKRIKRIILKV